jgi:hypothetical protein
VLSPGYVHVEAHPDHGEPVTYTPDEQLPGWMADGLDAGGELVAETDGTLTYRPPGRPSRPGKARGDQ